MESSERLEKEGSDTIKTTVAKNDLVWSLLGDGQKQETSDGHPYPDDGCNVLPTRRTLAVDAGRPDQTNAWCDKRLQSWQPTSIREDLRVPMRRFHQGVSKSNTATWTENIVPYQCRHSGASLDKAGQHRTMLEIKKRGRWKSQIQSDLSKSQLTHFEATDLALEELIFGRHRVEDVLRPSLTVADRVCHAAQRLGVRAAFWNLRYVERYDVRHLVNLRHLLRDIANGEILSCMMSVPTTSFQCSALKN